MMNVFFFRILQQVKYTIKHIKTGLTVEVLVYGKVS